MSPLPLSSRSLFASFADSLLILSQPQLRETGLRSLAKELRLSLVESPTADLVWEWVGSKERTGSKETRFVRSLFFFLALRANASSSLTFALSGRCSLGRLERSWSSVRPNRPSCLLLSFAQLTSPLPCRSRLYEHISRRLLESVRLSPSVLSPISHHELTCFFLRASSLSGAVTGIKLLRKGASTIALLDRISNNDLGEDEEEQDDDDYAGLSELRDSMGILRRLLKR